MHRIISRLLGLAAFGFFALGLTPGLVADESAGEEAQALEGDELVVRGTRAASQLQLAKPSAVGSNLDLSVLEMPVSIDMVGAEAMRQRGYNTAQEAAASTVGMISYLEKNANPLFSSRGFFRDNVVLLRDGLRLDSQVESSRPLDSFNLERVEVIKGPSSLMTGLGAVGASVNYVSKKPVRKGSQTEVLLGYDSFSRLRSGLAYSMGGPKLGFRVGATNLNQSKGWQDRTRQDNYDVVLALGSTPLEGLNVDAQFDYQTTDINGHNGIPTMANGLAGLQPIGSNGAILAPVALTNNYDVANAFSRSRAMRGRLDAKWELAPGFSLRNTAYAFDSYQEERFTDRYHVQANNLTVQVRVNDYRRWDKRQGDQVSLGLDLKSENLRLRSALGLDVRNEQVLRRDPFGTGTLINGISLVDPGLFYGPAANYDTLAPARSKAVDTDKITFFAEQHIELFERLQVLGGISVDQFQIRYQAASNQTYNPTSYSGVLNGRGGAVLKALEGLNLYGSYTTAALPNYAPVNISVANAKFQLENGRQWEGGLKTSLWQGRLEGTAAYYLIEKTDLVSFGETFPGSGVYTQRNVGKQSARGTELVLALRPWGGLLLEGSYAHTTPRFDDYRNKATNNRSGNTPSYVPTVQTQLQARYGFDMGLGLGLTHRHVGDRFSDEDNKSTMPAYSMIDADISYRRWNSSLTLRGKNLSNEKAIISARTPSANTTEFKVSEPLAVEAVFSSMF